MKKILILFLLPIFFYSCSPKKNSDPITWSMAVIKWSNSGYESFSPQQAITMENKDMYQIYIKTETPVYLYVIQEHPEKVFSIINISHIPMGQELYLPSEEGIFIIPDGTGNLRFHVVVSSSIKPKIEKYKNKKPNTKLSGIKYNDLNNEILSIRREISAISENPEKPVIMGGTIRGSAQMAYQYEGLDTYVKTITIRY